MLDSLLGRAGSVSAVQLNRLARLLLACGIGPNALTHAAMISGALSGLLFFLARPTAAFVLLLCSGLLDALDGRAARQGPGPTPWGGVLDLTYDRIVEAAVLLGICVPRPELHVPGLILAATWYVNLCVFLAVGAASERHSEKVIDYPPGWLERTDGLIFAAIAAFLPGWAAGACYAYAFFGILTAGQRFHYGREALHGLTHRSDPLS
jgi:phosphatidylglycerophosphate synthase